LPFGLGKNILKEKFKHKKEKPIYEHPRHIFQITIHLSKRQKKGVASSATPKPKILFFFQLLPSLLEGSGMGL